MDDLSDIIARLAKQLTGPVIRITIDENTVILDALPIYKSAKFDPTSPVTVQFQNQPAVDVGGPKREFYTRLFEDIAKADGGLNLVLFEARWAACAQVFCHHCILWYTDCSWQNDCPLNCSMWHWLPFPLPGSLLVHSDW